MVEERPVDQQALKAETTPTNIIEVIGKKLNDDELVQLQNEISRLQSRYDTAFRNLWSDLRDGRFTVQIVTRGNRSFSINGHPEERSI